MFKEYKFSITKNYVSDWGLTEGIREILQNAIDSSGEMELALEENALCIANKDIKLPIKSLLMGYGTKRNDDSAVGGKSEGSLLAIMVLIREGYSIVVENCDEVWYPKFIYDEDLDEEILVIEIQQRDSTNNKLVYHIENLQDNDMELLKNEFPMLNEIITGERYESIETQCGEIILDKNYAGKMFVEGLPIQQDNNFKFGYNFKTEYVNLDRDRKAINYYELRDLTAQSLVTAKECHPEIFKAIADSVTDIKDLEDVLEEASDEFLVSYRDMFYEDKNLEEGTIVATKAVKKQLEQSYSDIKVIEGSEIESYLMAKANDKLGQIYDAQNVIYQKSQLEKDLESFVNSKYLTLMELYLKIKSYLPKKWQKIVLEVIGTFVTPADKKCLKYIPDDFDYTEESARKLKNNILNNEEE